MLYIHYYKSPLGNILMAADSVGLTGLWFEGQKYFPCELNIEYKEKELPIFEQTKKWLDIYFSGYKPDFMPDVHMIGSEFQIKVWSILKQIPYGQTMTYGEIANKIAEQNGGIPMSAQAVGGAVGHNLISIIIPCHRVVGKNGSLTGYAGGIERKIKLLELENVNVKNFFIPKKGTAV